MSILKSFISENGTSSSQQMTPQTSPLQFSMIEINGILYYLSSLYVDECILNYSHTMPTTLLDTFVKYASGMSNQKLTYEDYNPKSVCVRGDRNKFTNIIKEVKGRWNPRMKGGEGWLVLKEFVPKLQELIHSMNSDSKTEFKQDTKIKVKLIF